MYVNIVSLVSSNKIPKYNAIKIIHRFAKCLSPKCFLLVSKIPFITGLPVELLLVKLIHKYMYTLKNIYL